MRVRSDEFYWGGFRVWLDSVGWPNSPTVGLALGDKRILSRLAEVQSLGSGQWREYGPRARARVRLYLQMQPIFGWGQHANVPAWCWDVIDYGMEHDAGYVIVEFSEDQNPVFSHQAEIDPGQIDFNGGALILIL